MSEEEKYFHEVCQGIEGTISSKMFGKLCYKVNSGKAFVCFFEDCMVFKLKEKAHIEALSFDGASLFDPSGKGRPMKEWVQIPFHYKDTWFKFAISAEKYVSKINKN